MFTDLMHPSGPLLAGLIIVLAQLGGLALVTGLVFAARRLHPALVFLSASSRRSGSSQPP
jgi:hypothetical protein